MFKFKADFLNQNCHCKTLDTKTLPAFFSAAPHFLSKQNLETIGSFIGSYEDFLEDPEVRRSFAAGYPVIEKGVFNSYDFHITAEGPRLIEINSNAGGALLSLLASENIEYCCDGMERYLPDAERRFDREKLIAMFRNEFQLRFPARELKRVAIVDEDPEAQFFFREFVLTRELLESAGIEAVIASPGELEIIDGVAYARGLPIDFVYNRLTDFYFEEAQSKTLGEIYRAGIAVVSPNPAIHALYAKKSNLVTLWEDSFSSFAGIEKIRAIIPETHWVTPQNSTRLWQERKSLFFKPVSGFGGKGVYRGDKITKKVWEHITSGGYIAQRYIEPTERRTSATEKFKYDLRVYTYGSEILGIAARYYQGQTTNFRTPNGGLATVLIAA